MPFYGQLAPEIEDKLTDAAEWKQNADTLVGIVDIGQTVLNECDEIYKVNLDEPLTQLLARVENLPDEQKAEVKEAVEEIQEKIRSQIRALLVSLHQQVAETLNWFQPEAIQKLLDRGDLQKLETD